MEIVDLFAKTTTTDQLSANCKIQVLHSELKITPFKEKNFLNALVYESHVLLVLRRRVHICTQQKVF